MARSNQVTLVVDSLRGGGSQRVCVNVANGLINLGWKVDLVLLNLSQEVYRQDLSKKVNLISLNVNHARYAFIPLVKYIIFNKPKIFLVFNYELTLLLIFLKIILNFKIKILTRNSNTLSLKRKQLDNKNLWSKYFVKPFIDNFYHRADHIINQCKGMKNDFIKLFPKCIYKTSIIYNPLSNKILDFIKSNDLNKIKKKNYLLCVGRLEKAKGMHYAIQAFAKISKKYPKLRLKILGQGTLKEELKKDAIKYGVYDRVDFEGFQKNIIPYYVYARLTILTSLFEGFPNNIIESISLGTPVVSFDCPNGPKEIIQNSRNGYLVKFKDVKDLENKLMSAIINKFNIKEMNLSIKKFEANKISRDYEFLLNSFL